MIAFCFLIAALASSALGAVLPPVPRLDGRIVGGTPANIKDAPYQVAALMDYWGTGHYFQSCGGSIISKAFVVTAAHCTDGTKASQWRIRAGSTYHNSGGVVVQVGSIIQNKDFNTWLENDISLLKLSTFLTLGETIATVTLPAQGMTIADGTMALATGWGTLTEGGTSPKSLYKVSIPVVNQKVCADAYEGFNPIGDGMICAGRIETGGEDACQGDSGGPLTVGNILVGITSWGRGCAQPHYPGVWTRVSSYRDWIVANM